MSSIPVAGLAKTVMVVTISLRRAVHRGPASYTVRPGDSPDYMGAIREYNTSSEPDAGPERPLSKLIDVIERAAMAGWSETARLIVLLAAAAAAIALVILASRYYVHG